MQRLIKSVRDSRPLAERVYETVRDSIVNGDVGADSQLIQEQVAEQLGVSRTPVRDALNRLAHEGLVTWTPGTGYLVNDLTEQDITDVYQVRYNLETLAARLACGRHSQVQLARLAALIEEMAAEDPSADARHFDLNRKFHRAVIEPCGNQLLIQIIDNLWNHPVNRRITKAYVHDHDNVGTMVAEHRDILAAARAGDEDRLVALVAKHMVLGYSETVPESLAPSGGGLRPPPLDPNPLPAP